MTAACSKDHRQYDVARLIRFNDDDDAVRIANDTPLGLAACVWSANTGRAHRVAGRLRAGPVSIDTYRRSRYVSLFGGFKESGLGRENVTSDVDGYNGVKGVWLYLGGAITDPFNPRVSREVI